MSNAARRLRSLQTHDPECSRTTHRLRHALAIAIHAIGNPQIAHDPDCDREIIQYLQPTPCKGSDQYGYRPCTTITWPEWATDDIFDRAYALACAVVTAQGEHNRKQAAEARRSR